MLSIADAPHPAEVLNDHENPPQRPHRRRHRTTDNPSAHKLKGHRRVPKSKERSFRYVMAAVPKGSQRAKRGSVWLEEVREDAEIVLMRADAQRNIRAVSVALMASLHAKTMTVSPGWDWLMDTTHLSESTVKRTIRLLRRRGLLGLVAGGRLAEHGTAGQTTNDRAVYVLCIRTENMPVDTSGRPTPVGVRSTPRARERLEELKAKGAATPLDPCTAEAYGLAPSPVADAPRQPAWPGNKPIQGRTRRERHEAGLAAARTLRARSLPLQKTSPAWVLWACKAFFDAGWTANDIFHATDHHPKNDRIAHDGAEGVKYPARWLAARLGAWTKDGKPIESRSQREAREAAQHAAERKAEADRRALRRASQLAAAGTDREQSKVNARGAAAALAVLRGQLSIDEAHRLIGLDRTDTRRNDPTPP